MIFVILLLIQFFTSEVFQFTKIRQQLFISLLTASTASLFLQRQRFVTAYLLGFLPLFSLVFIKITANHLLTANDAAHYSVFCLAITNIIFLFYYCSSCGPAAKLFLLPAFFCQSGFFLFAVAVWGYYFTSTSFLNATTCLALLQTNFSESLEYLQTNFTVLNFLLVAVLFLAYAWATITLITKIRVRQLLRFTAVIIIFLLLANIFAMYKASDNFLFKVFKETQVALQRYADFEQQKTVRQQSLAAITSLQSSSSGVYVLVIGESQNKDHMAAYGYGRATTPWLTSMLKQENFFLFQNAYSCHSHTVPVLTYALTAKNQYNALALGQESSIVEVAQAAGFQTVWVSNQVKYGAWDTPIAVIADQAQQQYWHNGHLGETTQTTYYDLQLIDTLKKLSFEDKTLLVIHIMGNHQNYQERYPREFRQWFKDSKNKSVDEYDNSILYNDYVMQQLYTFLKTLPNFQGLVYFSDHADDVDANLAHDASNFTFNMARIPLYMYFSDNYLTNNQQTLAALKHNTSAYFTNDMIFDTLINIMHIQLPTLETKNSLANLRYRHTPNDLKTLYGQKSISEDLK